MEINPSEVTKILKEQIKKIGDQAEITEVGQVLSVGDGIARIYGLDNVQAGEMVEFSDGSKGMALNLENDNVGVVIFGDDRAVKVELKLKHQELFQENQLVNLCKLDLSQ